MPMYVGDMRIQVIGAGVSGLTTGICLAEAGHDVTIRTAAPPERTTSVAAGPIWGPVMTGPPGRALGWAQISLETLSKLAGEAGTGVRMATGKEITRTEPILPFWSGLLPGLRECEPAELPPGFSGGWRYTAPLANMPVYLTAKPLISERIVADCAGIEARLDGVRIIGHRVGLRPFRPQVRLEREEFPDGTVLWHNYGHGGAGVSLSWGCATEVTAALD
jgi:D-amino-acid oxidase